MCHIIYCLTCFTAKPSVVGSTDTFIEEMDRVFPTYSVNTRLAHAQRPIGQCCRHTNPAKYN